MQPLPRSGVGTVEAAEYHNSFERDTGQESTVFRCSGRVLSVPDDGSVRSQRPPTDCSREHSPSYGLSLLNRWAVGEANHWADADWNGS